MKKQNSVLWQPTEIESTLIHQFQKQIENNLGLKFANYREFHRFSVENQNQFWLEAIDFFDIPFHKKGSPEVFAPQKLMRDCKWFEGYELNYTEMMLANPPEKPALVAINEKSERRTYTFEELKNEVFALARALKKLGVKNGDRIAGYLPNNEYPVIAFLASNALGAIWTSCAAEFGIRAVAERLNQTEPKVLFTTDTYQYGNKTHNLVSVDEILKAIPSIEKVVMVAGAKNHQNEKIVSYEDFKSNQEVDSAEIHYASLDFNHPLYVLYSSGTTGKPKCITHAVGRVLINHLKEHQLHSNFKAGDVVFFYTTCGWMMWNWLVSALGSGATIVLYDGSPFASKNRIFDLIETEQINHCGLGAKIVDTFETLKLQPKKTHDLSSLKSILTTASPLLAHSFRYVYQTIKSDVILSSISGGTDIVGCFLMGNPTLAVHESELQCLGLGMDLDVVDEKGKPVRNEQGELICKQPFITMPIGFWGDDNNQRFHDAYFNRFENIWAHGDFAELIEHPTHDSLVISGRSDATLNPQGVRIGTAEIYQVVESIEGVCDCAAVGHKHDNDERIVLFVVLDNGLELDEKRIQAIKSAIRTQTSPRHVPALIIQTKELPRTMSGKITEIAIKQCIHGEEVKNTSAIANPQSLEFFKTLKLTQ